MVVAYEDSFVCIEGAILLLFLVPLGSFWVVFRQKNNRLTAQSVVVNC